MLHLAPDAIEALSLTDFWLFIEALEDRQRELERANRG